MHRICQCKLFKSLALFLSLSYSHTHTHTYRKGISLGVWAWISFQLPMLLRLLLLRLPELEFLLYGQFRRIVSSAVALARFFFATHLNLDFTEFNFAVRMTLPAAYLCVLCVCVCVMRMYVCLNFCVMNSICSQTAILCVRACVCVFVGPLCAARII